MHRHLKDNWKLNYHWQKSTSAYYYRDNCYALNSLQNVYPPNLITKIGPVCLTPKCKKLDGSSTHNKSSSNSLLPVISRERRRRMRIEGTRSISGWNGRKCSCPRRPVDSLQNASLVLEQPCNLLLCRRRSIMEPLNMLVDKKGKLSVSEVYLLTHLLSGLYSTCLVWAGGCAVAPKSNFYLGDYPQVCAPFDGVAVVNAMSAV